MATSENVDTQGFSSASGIQPATGDIPSATDAHAALAAKLHQNLTGRPDPKALEAADGTLREAFNKMLEAEGSSERIAVPQGAAKKPATGDDKTTAGDRGGEPAKGQDGNNGTPQGQAPEADAAFEDAVKALRFLGLSTKDIESLGRDRVQAIGQKAHAASRETSAKINDLTLQLQAKGGGAAQPTKTGEPAVGNAAAQGQPFDLAARVKPIVEAIGDEDVGPALVKLLQDFRADVIAESTKGLGDLRDLAEGAGSLAMEGRMERARAALPENIRRLADDTTFHDRIFPKAATLMQAAKLEGTPYRSIDDAVHDAASIVLRSKIDAEAVAFRTKKASAQDAGQLTDTTSLRTGNRPRTPDDKLRAAFDLVEQGAAEADIRAAMAAN